MTNEEFARARATMPWREYTLAQGKQTLIKILDRHGNEVPLFTIVAFVTHMSYLLARQPEREGKDETVPEAKPGA